MTDAEERLLQTLVSQIRDNATAGGKEEEKSTLVGILDVIERVFGEPLITETLEDEVLPFGYIGR